MALKFKTVLTQLQMKIISGEWSEGFKMPTEMELCGQFGVSRVTIRRALEELVSSGYINRTRGRGSFVLFNRTAVKLGYPQMPFSSTNTAFKGKYRILLKEKLFANLADKQLIDVEDAESDNQLWHVKSLHMVENKPTVLSDYYIAGRFGEPLMTMEDESDTSIFEIISNYYGQTCHFVKGKVAAISPNDEICKQLQLDPHSANLWCRGMCILDDGTVVGRCTKIFDGLVYEFSIE
ncbi:GntR family transcriptional regulator [Sphaerochaeta sp. PS]|uniref:GntR family transcriptional regulator n=1 Tax=Sphaerochaeta sp. PS TaxID=3076336 RepID=UPI0028A491CC|nr:GntR family transcriptional regulator [Sphaerochaeta sp. PS]MDT4761935.1 GntR family transcriptional regulator [Sphaerochaeta sp. PS]